MQTYKPTYMTILSSSDLRWMTLHEGIQSIKMRSFAIQPPKELFGPLPKSRCVSQVKKAIEAHYWAAQLRTQGDYI